MNLAQERVLLAAPRRRTFVKELCRDATIEFVQVHGFNASLQTLVADPQLFDGLGARSLLGPIRLQHRLRQPLEDRLGNHQISQDAGKLGGEFFLPGVWLGALSPVAGAVIVDIAAFFQFTDQVAPAMTAMDQTGERKIVLDLPGLVLDPRIQQLLNAFPTRAAHQWFLATLVCDSIPVEFTHVQAVAKDLMNETRVDPTTAERAPFAPELRG